MKKFLFLPLIMLMALISGCGKQSGVIDEAYEMAKNHEDVVKVANMLADGGINCSTLSTEEYTKLGVCLLYVTMQGSQEPDFAQKVDIKKLEKLATDFAERDKNMTEQERQEVMDNVEKILTE